MIGDWYASTDEEHFNGGPYDSKAQAIRVFPAEWDLETGDDFWVGQASETYFNICGGGLVEGIGQQVFDQVGECSDGWPECTDEQEKELGGEVTKVVEAWIARHSLAPSFFAIVDPERFVAK